MIQSTYRNSIRLTVSRSLLHRYNNELSSFDDYSPISYTPTNHSCLFNSMIYPFTRMTLYGFIWYQGESNVGDPMYACKFSKMIANWRQVWYNRTNGTTDPNFPFGFVQVNYLRE